MEIFCRELSNWPRSFTEHRRRAQFKTSFDRTIKLLKFELSKLEAETIVVQTAFKDREISVTTGWPRADRRPEHPGVIVATDTKYGPQKYICDASPEWTQNVHAIVLTLERLRLVDLYGVTKRGEQYLGWKMLPGPITADGWAKPMSMDEAARVIAAAAGEPGLAAAVMKSRDKFIKLNREAASRTHPDAGGKPEQWKRLSDAAALMNSLHSRK